MISSDILQQHYLEYAAQSDDWVENMAVTKKSIVAQVIKASKFSPISEPVKVAVLGASDPRYIKIHKRLFEEILRKKIELITLDLDTVHLGGKSASVMQWDVTKKFPASFDVIFSHELMKFLTPSEQIATIINSFNALNRAGIAMHIIHEPSIKGTSELRTWQNRVNPDELIQKLAKENISATKLVFNSKSNVDWLKETTVILIKK